MRFLSWFALLGCFLLPLKARAFQPDPIPDAPLPHQKSDSGTQPQDVTQTSAGRVYAPRYDRVVFPGELAHRLTVRDKFVFAARQTIEPINLTPAIISAGYGEYSNGDPKYGTGAGAFGERFGAAVLRQDSYRLLADGFMPILLREDPRYYRLGQGTLAKRFFYAVGQAFMTRTDSGRTVPNYAGLLGRGIASSLTYTYYPDPSANARVVLDTFGTSVAGDAGLNILRELTPEEVFKRLKQLHLRITGE